MIHTLKKVIQNYSVIQMLVYKNLIKFWFHYEVYENLKYYFLNRYIMSWAEKER